MSLLGKIMVKLGWDNSEFHKGEKDAERNIADFSGKLKSMTKKLGAAAVAFTLLKKAFNFGKEAYNTAAQAEGVERAFKKLNDPNLLNQLREATQGTVSDLELMQNAIQAKNFKIPLENLATYLQFANERAKATNQSVDYLVQSIVIGVGRKSPLILDNLGISALEVREEFAKTGDMAKAVSNIINREMGGANEVIRGSKELIGQSNAAWKNTIAIVGNWKPIKVIGDAWNVASSSLANFITNLFKTNKEIGENEKRVREEGQEINMLISRLTNVNTKENERKLILDKLKEVQPKIVEGLNAENVAAKQLIATAKEYNKELVARIALATRQDSVSKAVNAQLSAGEKLLNKESEISKYLLELQGQLATIDIEKGFFNQAQGITRWRKITNEERSKIISDYAEIIAGTGDWNDKMAAAYKLFSNSSFADEKTRGVNLKPFFNLSKDFDVLEHELNDATKQAEIAAQEIKDFEAAFSQVFKKATQKETNVAVRDFKKLISEIQSAETKLIQLRKGAQEKGDIDTAKEKVSTAESELSALTEEYKQLTGKEWGVKVAVKTDKDQLKKAGENSVAYLENKLSELQLAVKFEVDDKKRLALLEEISGIEATIKVKMDIQEPKTERQTIEDSIKQYEDMQLAIPIGLGTPEDIATAQAEWNRLAGFIKQAKEELEKFPKAPEVAPPPGSLAAYSLEIAQLDKDMQNLTGVELNAAIAARSFAEIMQQGASVGWNTQLEIEVLKLNNLQKALEGASEERKKWLKGEIAAQQEIVDNAGKVKDNVVDIGTQLSSQLGSALATSVSSLFEGLFSGDEEKSAEEKTQAILQPFAQMVTQLGEYAIAMGIAGIAIEKLIDDPYLAVAAGIALVALGKVAEAGVAKITSGKGSPSSPSDTFTGGYSYSGSGNSTINQMQLAAPSPQVVVLETKVSGSDIIFVSEKEKMRRGK